ncbi:MAG: PAS domain S-box protein, partial [Spirochaetota bacterium]
MKEKQRLPGKHVLIFSGTFIVYLAGFGLMFIKGATHIAALIGILPVIAAAFFWGTLSGILAGFIIGPVTLLYTYILDHSYFEKTPVSYVITGSFLFMIVGLIVGRIVELNKKLKTEIQQRCLFENALKKSEELYRLLFNTGNDIVAVYSLTKDYLPLNFIDVNDAACKFLGYSREELLKMSPLDISATADQRNNSKIQESLRKHKSARFKQRVIAKNGKKYLVEINGSIFEYNHQKMMLSIARDITEQECIQAALAESEKRLKEAERHSHIGSYEFEVPNGKVIWSKETFRITGSLDEKELLLKEIHHRVKNNLTLISGILNLERERLHDSHDCA